MGKYVLGVDGGNTKTDFLLFTDNAEFVDVLRAGTCSHEAAGMGYDRAYEVLRGNILTLLSRNSLTLGDLSSAAMGLAGIDLPSQHREMMTRLSTLGIPHLSIANDSMLGIKASTPSGYGICSVNGTGTVTLGVDSAGKMLQVGGIGGPCGDAAGGSHIALMTVARVHDELYRALPRTLLCEKLMSLFGANDKESYLQSIADVPHLRSMATEIIIACEECACEGDPEAMDILDTVGRFLGRSAAGCALGLSFDQLVDVVFIGSVWVKCFYPGMREAFEKEFMLRAPAHTPRIEVLSSPPATGGIVWALTLADPSSDYAALKSKVLGALTNSKYESLTSCYIIWVSE